MSEQEHPLSLKDYIDRVHIKNVELEDKNRILEDQVQALIKIQGILHVVLEQKEKKLNEIQKVVDALEEHCEKLHLIEKYCPDAYKQAIEKDRQVALQEQQAALQEQEKRRSEEEQHEEEEDRQVAFQEEEEEEKHEENIKKIGFILE